MPLTESGIQTGSHRGNPLSPGGFRYFRASPDLSIPRLFRASTGPSTESTINRCGQLILISEPHDFHEPKPNCAIVHGRSNSSRKPP